MEEGRAIYDNIRRSVKFSIAGNIGKVLVMLPVPVTGTNVALLPLQVLWLNLLTDDLLGGAGACLPFNRGVDCIAGAAIQSDLVGTHCNLGIGMVLLMEIEKVWLRRRETV